MSRLSKSLLTVTLCLFAIDTASAKNPKRGIAFAESNGNDIGKTANSQISWVYAWEASPPSYLKTSGLEFIPMQWGSAGADQFQSIVKGLGAKTILGFNEPDLAGQSNLSPGDAANIWKQFIQPLHSQGVRLGAPAVSAAPGGMDWLASFISACNGCTIDFVPLHWYGDGSQFFEQYVRDFHSRFNYPIWVTEWASTSSSPDVALDFLKQTTSFLDSTQFVERYSWFAFERNTGSDQFALLNSDGSLNARGQAYIVG